MTTNKTSKKADPAANAAKMQRGRPFEKGKSGNPSGKKPGTKHRVTLLAEKLLDDEAEDVIKVCIELAKSGDSTAIKMILDRVLPLRKDRPVSLVLPQLESAEDAAKAMKSIANAVSEGEITPSEAQILSAVIENYRKVTETTILEKRIVELERRTETK